MNELSLGEVTSRTGESARLLRRWRSIGVIGAQGTEGFAPADVEKVRLVQTLLRRGIAAETIARASRRGALDRYIQLLFPGGVGREYSVAEAAGILQLDTGLLQKIWAAAGLAEEGEPVREEDLEGLRLLGAAMQVGFSEEALVQAVRVYADALGRVAEMEGRLFHFYVHERLRASGLSEEELTPALWQASEQANLLMEPAVLFFHRKGLQRAIKADMVLDLAEEASATETDDAPGRLTCAVVFVDLASFTPLAEAMGDAKAAEVLERFSGLVRGSAARCEGRVVKQIGDSFMLVFPDARSAVTCALELEARTAEEPQFPAARTGVHWGQVLYREGDYVGSNVNIAARVAREAERHEVLVTGAVRRRAKDLPDVRFVSRGRRRLRGLAEDVQLFEARPKRGARRQRLVDPVCGMELGPGDVAARLSVGAEERAFCTDECLRQFVANPQRYAG